MTQRRLATRPSSSPHTFLSSSTTLLSPEEEAIRKLRMLWCGQDELRALAGKPATRIVRAALSDPGVENSCAASLISMPVVAPPFSPQPGGPPQSAPRRCNRPRALVAPA